MKNINILKKLGTVMMITGVVGLLAGCTSMTVYRYKDGENYTPGDRDITEKIETINLDYRSGDVMIQGSSDDKVTIRETAAVELDDSKKVHSWVNGSTLYVRYCASSARLSFEKLDKKLTLTVPEDIDLKNIKVEVSSCDIVCEGFSSDKAELSCASGSICSSIEASDYKATMSSGEIEIRQKGKADSVEISSTSGKVNADLGEVDKLRISSTSGTVNLCASEAKELNFNLTSGNSDMTLLKAPADSSIHVVSGDLNLYLPEDSDIKASVSVTSGDFDYDLPFKKQDGVYVAGTGENDMEIHMSSGDVNIRALN